MARISGSRPSGLQTSGSRPSGLQISGSRLSDLQTSGSRPQHSEDKRDFKRKEAEKKFN